MCSNPPVNSSTIHAHIQQSCPEPGHASQGSAHHTLPTSLAHALAMGPHTVQYTCTVHVPHMEWHVVSGELALTYNVHTMQLSNNVHWYNVHSHTLHCTCTCTLCIVHTCMCTCTCTCTCMYSTHTCTLYMYIALVLLMSCTHMYMYSRYPYVHVHVPCVTYMYIVHACTVCICVWHLRISIN